MPIAMTAQQKADLANKRIPKAAVWFANFYLDAGTIRISDQAEELLYQGNTYEAQHKTWRIPTEITFGSGLSPERIDFEFDGADRYVENSLFARFLAGGWHLRQFDLALALYNAETGEFIVEARKLYGFMNELTNPEGDGADAWAVLNCETGTFRILSARKTQVSDDDQRKRNPSDGFMRNVGVKGSENIPFGISNSNIPGVSNASNFGRF